MYPKVLACIMEMNTNPIVKETSPYLFKSLACLKTRDPFFSELQKLLAFQTVHTSKKKKMKYLFYRFLWTITPQIYSCAGWFSIYFLKKGLKYSCSLCRKYPVRTVTARGENN